MPSKKKPPSDDLSTQLELHKVLIHNDEKTTMEFVVFLLMSVFNKVEEEATKIR